MDGRIQKRRLEDSAKLRKFNLSATSPATSKHQVPHSRMRLRNPSKLNSDERDIADGKIEDAMTAPRTPR